MIVQAFSDIPALIDEIAVRAAAATATLQMLNEQNTDQICIELAQSLDDQLSKVEFVRKKLENYVT
jgi:hypothetical protein